MTKYLLIKDDRSAQLSTCLPCAYGVDWYFKMLFNLTRMYDVYNTNLNDFTGFQIKKCTYKAYHTQSYILTMLQTAFANSFLHLLRVACFGK